MSWGFKEGKKEGKTIKGMQTQRYVAKNKITGKTLIVPNFLLFPFSLALWRSAFFPPKKSVL